MEVGAAAEVGAADLATVGVSFPLAPEVIVVETGVAGFSDGMVGVTGAGMEAAAGVAVGRGAGIGAPVDGEEGRGARPGAALTAGFGVAGGVTTQVSGYCRLATSP